MRLKHVKHVVTVIKIPTLRFKALGWLLSNPHQILWLYRDFSVILDLTFFLYGLHSNTSTKRHSELCCHTQCKYHSSLESYYMYWHSAAFLRTVKLSLLITLNQYILAKNTFPNFALTTLKFPAFTGFPGEWAPWRLLLA